MERILIVEDDEGISSMIKLELEHEGYETEIASDGKAALSAFESASWNLILLDVMMPEMNGLEVLRRIRKTSTLPVILVTARGETYDKVAGLDSGADDYISKPFAMEELLARIRSLLRRKNEWSEKGDTPYNSASSKTNSTVTNSSTVNFSDISINTKSCTVTVAGKQVSLTKTEYELLLFFVQHHDEALSRDKIIDAVWGEEHFIESGAVDVYVRYLRAKIDSEGKPSHITTMRGIGYMMKSSEEK